MEIILPSLCDMFENQRINGVKQIFINKFSFQVLKS
jgi:hypothetical protein